MRGNDTPPLCDLPEGATLDRLAADRWIFQPRKGQRWSTDDLLLAWTGVETRPQARDVLDLGAGTGAVGLLALVALGPAARLTAVEIQSRSAALLRRTVALQGWEDRVEVREGDLRDPAVLGGRSGFDLVLANPPYLPAGRATASGIAARARARLELDGEVADWCLAAARVLASRGAFCLAFSASDPRPEAAARAAGLACRSRRPVVFRAGQPPALMLYGFERDEGSEGPVEVHPPLEVRDARGGRTEALRAVRRAMCVE
ncbi:MAG: methyltransferase [Deltaproteobacteria bacterium]|nr:methyltransferase [Deltaproteobacteria bacterium]